MHQPVGEVAVGGEDDETFAVEIEPAGAEKAELGKLPWQQLENSSGVMGIVVRTNEPAGFVHDDSDPWLGGRSYRLAADGDPVDARGDFLTEGGRGTVDPYLTLCDQRFRRPARANSRIGDEFLQTNRFGTGHGWGEGVCEGQGGASFRMWRADPRQTSLRFWRRRPADRDQIARHP